MYESYFGLTERPFSIAPDPQYLYMSARHKEAMAHLSYGLSQGGCFIVLTGEVGTGKTTLCRNLLMDLPDNVDVALILNANINETELLQTICDELKIEYQAQNSQKQLLDLINSHLLDTFANSRHTVLIIDEAQLLSRDVLEQIRLLTNLETTKNKLLQIILIGQPELSEVLTRNDLRQLAQRVTARYHLGALKQSEIEEYVNYRLSVAGCRQPLFTKQALTRLHQVTDGIPRKINVLADHALLAAYSQSQQTVGSDNIKQASKEVFFNTKTNKEKGLSKMKWWAPALALVLINLTLWWFFIGKDNNEITEVDLQNASVTEVETPVSTQQPIQQQPIEKQADDNNSEQLDQVEEEAIVKPIVSEDVTTETAVESAVPEFGSVTISQQFLDAEGGVVETVQNPQIMQDVDFSAEVIEPANVASGSLSAAGASPATGASPAAQGNTQVSLAPTEFGRILETSADVTGRFTAFRELVALWGLSLPEQIINPLCTEVANTGLRCLTVSNWSQLMRYNRPAMLVLVHDNQLHRVIVESVDGESAEVRVGETIYRIGIEELQARWNGAGLSVWRPSEVGFAFLQLGSNGPAVANARAYLNKALAQTQLPILDSIDNTLFDQDLSQKVFTLQTTFGIISDSKIGNETYLLMNELVSPSASPVLTRRAR